ncbi:MAG: 2-dehydropantoate 2-reductase [Candidatus Hydrogenedentes bacterium]|nr:2-dehydropantoate 2-reductase [Candidatus Hydrogenedentota bacterium]
MHIIIFGERSVGLGLGSALLKAGATVDFVGSEETVHALRQSGLSRRGIFGTVDHPPSSFCAATRLADLPDEPCDYLLVTVKSFDTAAASQAIAAYPALSAQTRIVLLQNGWGNAEIFVESVPQARIFSGRVITGFRRPEPHQVDITVHADAVHLGSLFGAARDEVAALAEAMSLGGIPCITTDTIGADLWAKLLYNCALNPLGAILQVTYGTLGANAHTRRIMDAVVHEAFAAMQAAGHATHWSSPDAYLDDFYHKMLPPTADHESSMLQDIRSGRRPEIEAITGAVLDLAGRHGLEAPHNAMLFHMIRFLHERPGRQAD